MVWPRSRQNDTLSRRFLVNFTLKSGTCSDSVFLQLFVNDSRSEWLTVVPGYYLSVLL